jgi:hypothetical protein
MPVFSILSGECNHKNAIGSQPLDNYNQMTCILQEQNRQREKIFNRVQHTLPTLILRRQKHRENIYY